MADEPHQPARNEDSANEHGKTIQAITDLVARRVALRNAEHDRGKNREQQGGGEMRELEAHRWFDFMASCQWRCDTRQRRR